MVEDERELTTGLLSKDSSFRQFSRGGKPRGHRYFGHPRSEFGKSRGRLILVVIVAVLLISVYSCTAGGI
jgi:hypothetical protein